MSRQLLAMGLLAILTALLAACGSEPPTAGVATPFAAVCARENDGQRVAVEGYLRLPDTFTESQSVILRMHETDAFDGTPLGVSIRFGAGPNQIAEVSDMFSDDDLKVHLADGATAGFGTKVTVSGKVYFPIVDQVFPCALENPLVELAD